MGVNSHQAFDEKPGIKFVWPYHAIYKLDDDMQNIQPSKITRYTLAPKSAR